MTCQYFWGLLWEAFRWGQMLSNRVTCDDVSLLRILTLGSLPLGQLLSLVTGLLLMTFHCFGWLFWEAFRRGQLLSNRVAF